MWYPKNILAILCVLLCLVPSFAVAAAERADASFPALSVDVPATVGDGTAFPCVITAPGLSAAVVTFLERTVTAQADEKGVVTLLLPVPLEHGGGDAPLAWRADFPDGLSAKGTVTVTIRKKIYPAQRLTLAPKYVTPDPALNDRIAKERELLGAALTTKSPVRHWTLPMLRPVSGEITSLYGLRRILNGESKSSHKGLDFRGAAGTPIRCIADGTVVLTGDFYYPGMFAVVDHGLGVTSIYMHMSDIAAVRGRAIRAGDIVGLVGSTGRSTGPHLHLGITVLGQTIDAFPLLSMTEADEKTYAKAFSEAAQEERQPKKKAAGQKSPSPGKKTSGKKTAKKNTAGSARKTQ